MILHSNINHRNSLTGDDIVGFYVSDFLDVKDTALYYDAVKECLRIGVAVCSFEVQNTIFVCAMKRISSKRIKVTEIGVRKNYE